MPVKEKVLIEKHKDAEVKPKRVYKKRVPKVDEVVEVENTIIDESIEENEIIIKYPTDDRFNKVHDIEFPELKEKVKQLLNLK